MMINTMPENNYIFTNKAKCQDCYRCVRVCPVKAVGVKDGQAYVDEKRCIFCGKCIVECPQQAKYYRKDTNKVKELIAADYDVVAAVAPSFAGLLDRKMVKRFASAMRLLGFSLVVEVAEGARYVTDETLKIAGKGRGNISTSCPAVVEYAEKYRPDLLETLIPVPSPMIAQAKLIKRRRGPDSKTVFIGPCVAKKREADFPEHEGLIDAVLTFEELFNWLKESEIELSNLEESGFDWAKYTGGESFCLSGGFEEAAGVCGSSGGPGAQILCMSSYERMLEAFNIVDEGAGNLIVEPLICSMGCINGPGINSEINVLRRRLNVQAYSKEKKETGEPIVEEQIQLVTSFRDKSGNFLREFEEEQIRDVMNQTGKYTKEDELNCGACGYLSCRDKAKAVLSGMAEIKMCIPYMRRFAERKADEIIDKTPNGIIVLDRSLQIISVNESFMRMFMCTGSSVGKHLSTIMDPDLFEKVVSGASELIEERMNFAKYSLSTEAKIFKMSENSIAGIFVDITKVETDKKQLDTLRGETLKKAEELLEHQVKTAQFLAKILGEGTAKSEALLDNLMKLTEDDTRKGSSNKSKWLWDIYTSK
jgi:iron only hydrogenase large subunit-like protein